MPEKNAPGISLCLFSVVDVARDDLFCLQERKLCNLLDEINWIEGIRDEKLKERSETKYIAFDFRIKKLAQLQTLSGNSGKLLVDFQPIAMMGRCV